MNNYSLGSNFLFHMHAHKCVIQPDTVKQCVECVFRWAHVARVFIAAFTLICFCMGCAVQCTPNSFGTDLCHNQQILTTHQMSNQFAESKKLNGNNWHWQTVKPSSDLIVNFLGIWIEKITNFCILKWWRVCLTVSPLSPSLPNRI